MNAIRERARKARRPVKDIVASTSAVTVQSSAECGLARMLLSRILTSLVDPCLENARLPME
jgi:hypothetical protein